MNRTARLCGKSVADTESRVQESKHDSVCATYNLLLDEAMKKYKAGMGPRSNSATDSILSPESIANNIHHSNNDDDDNDNKMKKEDCQIKQNVKSVETEHMQDAFLKSECVGTIHKKQPGKQFEIYCLSY